VNGYRKLSKAALNFKMLEIPQKTFAVPPPIPVPVARPVRLDDPIVGLPPIPGPPPLPAASQIGGQTDKVAVASTVCGLTAFIPIFTQVVGLILGIWALLRIRRARRAGQNFRGRGWATAGIAGNGFALLGWIMLLGAFAVLKGTLGESAQKLHPLLKKPPAHHVRVRK
jgi:hypothetical protein